MSSPEGLKEADAEALVVRGLAAVSMGQAKDESQTIGGAILALMGAHGLGNIPPGTASPLQSLRATILGSGSGHGSDDGDLQWTVRMLSAAAAGLSDGGVPPPSGKGTHHKAAFFVGCCNPLCLNLEKMSESALDLGHTADG